MDFQHACLHQREQAVEVLDREQFLALASLHAVDAIADEARARVLLEEAFPAMPSGQRNSASGRYRCGAM